MILRSKSGDIKAFARSSNSVKIGAIKGDAPSSPFSPKAD